MHILYLDESGTHGEARQHEMAGLSVFERETYFLARELEQLQADYFPGRQQPVNLRASSLRAPDGRVEPPFDELTSTRRVELLIRIYSAIAASRVRLFGIAIEKAQFTGSHYERGFEDIVSRFDQMLSRMGRKSEPQRGLIVVAESSYRENIVSLPVKSPNTGIAGAIPTIWRTSRISLRRAVHACCSWPTLYPMRSIGVTNTAIRVHSIPLCPALTRMPAAFTVWCILPPSLGTATARPASPAPAAPAPVARRLTAVPAQAPPPTGARLTATPGGKSARRGAAPAIS